MGVRNMDEFESGVVFNVLIKKVGDEFVAHCLELDIVTTADDLDRVQSDMAELIEAQIDYAFSNDNLENLYHPAPPDIWQEFFSCHAQMQKRREVKSSAGAYGTVPAWMIAKACGLGADCFVH